MAKNRQGSNASKGGKGSGIVGFQRVTTGRDHIPSPSEVSSFVQVKDRDEESASVEQERYAKMEQAMAALRRGQAELDEEVVFFSELESSDVLSAREADLLGDACENSVIDMVDVGAGKRAVAYARKDPVFGSQVREVFFNSRTGGTWTDLAMPKGTFASSELGMLHEMYMVQRDNPEWKPLYTATCAFYRYLHSRGDKTPPPVFLYLDREMERMQVKFPHASAKDPVGMRLNDALAEGWFGPAAG